MIWNSARLTSILLGCTITLGFACGGESTESVATKAVERAIEESLPKPWVLMSVGLPAVERISEELIRLRFSATAMAERPTYRVSRLEMDGVLIESVVDVGTEIELNGAAMVRGSGEQATARLLLAAEYFDGLGRPRESFSDSAYVAGTEEAHRAEMRWDAERIELERELQGVWKVFDESSARGE